MRQRGPAGGYSVSYRPDGNRVAMSGLRPAAVINGLPERGEPAAPLLVFNSYAAGVKEQPEPFARSSRRMKIAKRYSRSARFG